MKDNLVNKVLGGAKNVVGNVKNNIGKYVAGAAIVASSLAYSPSSSAANLENDSNKNAQYSQTTEDFDFGKLTGMDVFSRPDLFGQGYEAFNGLSRAEKMPIINTAIAGDKTDEIAYAGDFQCGKFSYVTAFNTFGVENLEEWKYYDSFTEEQKTKIHNGKYNIPVYRVATSTQGSSTGLGTESSGHAINAIFVGPENSNEKHDPTKFNQWYFFEPQNDKEVKPGDFSMNENGNVNIYWFGYASADGQEWVHVDDKILAFDLNNGEATLDPGFGNGGIHSYLLREDPHTATVKLNPLENKLVERGSSEPDTSPAKTGTPTVETNLEHYTPILTHTDKDTTYLINGSYPEYFSFTRKFMADVKMGRWSGSNLSNLKDSTGQKITVDDTTAPTVVAPVDITIGYNAPTGIEKTGAASFSDDSPYGIEMWYEDSVVSEDNNYKIIERTHFGADVRNNIGSDTQRITIDLNVGIEELNASKTFDLDQNYPNPVTSSTTIPYASRGGGLSFKLIDNMGRTHRVIKRDGAFMGEDEFRINMTGMDPGIYFVVGRDDKGSTDRIKVIKK